MRKKTESKLNYRKYISSEELADHLGFSGTHKMRNYYSSRRRNDLIKLLNDVILRVETQCKDK